MKTIKEERQTQLYDSWEHETNDPDSEQWREDLTPAERALVGAWDDLYCNGLADMIKGTRTQGNAQRLAYTLQRSADPATLQALGQILHYDVAQLEKDINDLVRYMEKVNQGRG